MSNGLLIKSQRINYYTSEKYEFLIKLQASTTFFLEQFSRNILMKLQDSGIWFASGFMIA